MLVSLTVLCCLASATVAYDQYADIGNLFPYVDAATEAYYTIPEGFIIGAGSAAYQTEGAWNEDGKGESIWDHYFHYDHPNSSNGDVACDSYHKYKTDVQLVKNMKLDAYRLSLSWPRLLPNGTTDNVNQLGVDFYNNFINELINNSITPVVTLFHWDLPQQLEEKGGFLNASIQDYFADYAAFAFKTFGDRVKWWTTFNEPALFCAMGYANGIWAPGITDNEGVNSYQCAHNLILAHAKAYKAYYDNYSLQGGEVGITLNFQYTVPSDVNSTEDREAAERAMEFNYAWFADPVLTGKYPDSMRTRIDANSQSEGRNESRLPEFTAAEQKMLQASTDFLGVNLYGASTATASSNTLTAQCARLGASPDDSGTSGGSTPSNWTLGASQRTPWSLRGALNWIKNRYNNYPAFVTENGYHGTEAEGLNDFNRMTYLSGFMRGTLRAVNEDNCNVIGYSLWSLADNLEWTSGYGPRYGVSFTHFDDPNLKRVPKKSSTFLRQVMTSKKVVYYDVVES